MTGKFVLAVAAFLAVSIQATPLDEYVNRPDNAYRWSQTDVVMQGQGWKGYVLNMTSQAWLTPADWNFGPGRPAAGLWLHYMVVIVPDKLDPRFQDSGLVWVTGGSNNGSPPNNPTNQDMVLASTLCMNAGLVGAVLFQIPNQPIYFTEERPSRGRTEDAFIAWTWKHFMENHRIGGSPDWLARFPMTKAVVKAMDTVTAFRARQAPNLPKVNKFIISGASKRGWTTWTTGAVDKRVIGIVPIVLDIIKFPVNIRHMYRAYGGYSFALADYYDLNITAAFDTPEIDALSRLVDPYYFFDRLTMPKMIINAVGDEFLMPDDDHVWWNELPAIKHRVMCPNAEHSMITCIGEALSTISAFVMTVLTDAHHPVLEWELLENGGGLHVSTTHSSLRPTAATIWLADSAEGTGLRDFRVVAGYPTQHIQPILWLPSKLDLTHETWTVALPPPAQANRWRAWFVETTFDGPTGVGGPTKWTVTTQVAFNPDTFPFPPCSGLQCKGKLV